MMTKDEFREFVTQVIMDQNRQGAHDASPHGPNGERV
jgi:hypothetical protein